MSYFHIIRHCDPLTGNKRELKITQEVCANWKTIGELLGFTPGVIATVKNPGAGKTPEQCFCDIITRWMKNASKLPRKERYPNNWTGVYNLLEDAEHASLANHLKAAVEAICSDLHGNFEGKLIYNE